MKNQSVPAGTTTRGYLPFLPVNPEKVYQSIVDVVVAIDEQGVFRYVSSPCLSLFGYTDKEMTGASFLDFIHPDDVEKTVQMTSIRRHDCRTSHFENRYRKKDGSTVPIIWSGRWDQNDRLLYCVARDGTEKQEIENRLQKAQQIARMASYEFDIAANAYTSVSDTIFDIFGLDRRVHPVFTPELFWGSLHPDDRERVQNSLAEPGCFHTSTLEYRIIQPNGEVVYISRIREAVRGVEGKPLKYIGIMQDVTDRKISELALQQSEERFRSLVQNSGDMIAIIDPAGNYRFASDNVSTHLGYRVGDLVGKNAFDFIHADDTGWLAAALQEIQGKEAVTLAPFRFRDHLHRWRWVEVTVTNHQDNPAIGGMVVNSREVTEKKQKDDEMRKLSLIARETTNSVIIQDKGGRVLWVNNAFMQLTGYRLDECVGRLITEICDGPETDSETIRYVTEQVTRRQSFRVETLNYKKNGETYWSDVSCQPIVDEKGEVIQYFSIATDITERKQLEKQLEKERREQQIRVAAATLKTQEHERTVVSQELHDNVNQVLTTVKLYTEMCRDGVGNREEMLTKSISLLQNSIDEIRCLSKRLSAPSLGKIRLAESVKELTAAVGATNRFDVQLTCAGIEALDIAQDIHLAVYRILQEHLTNILKHAAAKRVAIRLEWRDGQLLLRVRDDGQGFDTGTKRCGIGITNMTTRAESLNGSLVIRSAPNEGCLLEVCLPCSVNGD